MFRLFLTLILTIAVASAASAAEPKAAKTDADNVSTAREFVSRLVAHGVTAEAIEKSFGKPVAELSDEDVPRLQRGLDRLRAKIAPDAVGADPEFAEERQQVKANVELWEARVRAKLNQVNKIMNGLDLHKIQSQKLTVDALLEVLDSLDEEARSIIAAHQQVQPDLKLYREALLKAPAVFRRIAETMEKRAGEHKTKFIKGGYADFAAEARKYAAKAEADAAGVGSLEADLAAKINLVEESRGFIADVRELLNAIPTSHGIETEQFIGRLNTYINVLQEAIDTMKGAVDKIGEPRSSSPDESKPVPLTGIRRATILRRLAA